MKDERIRAEHPKEMPALLDPDTEVELHCAEVGEQRHIGRERAHVKCREHVGPFEKNAARTKTHRQSVGLGDARESLVDDPRLLRATGHARDEQRRADGPAEKAGAQLDIIEIDLGEGAMHETPVVEAGFDTLGSDVLVDVDAQVLVLARGRARSGVRVDARVSGCVQQHGSPGPRSR